MPITTIDPTTALIVIDLQRGVVALPLVHPVADVVARSVELVDAFRSHGLPVVLVNATGRPAGRTDRGPSNTRAFPSDWADLIDELDPQPTDLLITKQTGSAFPGTGLHEKLQELGVTQVVVTGISTSNGVESTALYAHNAGYHVTIALDAVTDPSAEAHAYTVADLFPRIAETGTTDEILAALASSRG